MSPLYQPIGWYFSKITENGDDIWENTLHVAEPRFEL
jgi:hypothetical protein